MKTDPLIVIWLFFIMSATKPMEVPQDMFGQILWVMGVLGAIICLGIGIYRISRPGND